MVMSQSTAALGTFGLMLILCLIYPIFRWRYEVMISTILALTIVDFISLITSFGSCLWGIYSSSQINEVHHTGF